MIVGFPPFELRCREIYLHTRGLSGEVGPVDADVKVWAQRAIHDRWRVSLDMIAGAPGLRHLETVLTNCLARQIRRQGAV